MSDIDDELLALAGGDVSDEEPEDIGSGREEAKSPQPVSSKETGSAKGTAAVKKAIAKKDKKHAPPDDSEEEGQA